MIVQDWFNANRLTLNVSKSSYLLFHGHKKTLPNFKIVLNNVEVPWVRHAKFLDTWLDEHLNWETHVNKVLTKVKCGIGMLRCSKNLLISTAKRLLYFRQIHSHLCYCLCIWGSMLQKNMLNKLVNAQRYAVSLIDPNCCIEVIFRKYKILRLVDMLHLEQCKMGYKLCHNLLPAKLAENMLHDHKSHSISKEHRYFTRGKKTPNLPGAISVKYRVSFLYSSIREYSALDHNLKQAQNLSLFVKNCKKLYLEAKT